MKFFMNKKEKKEGKEGFTVVETLVAVTILLVSIIGPMQIASKGLFAAMYAKDEITAFYLGQEAIEYVRNARDTDYLWDYYSGNTVPDPNDSLAWLAGLTKCMPPPANPAGNSNGCIVDVREPFRTDAGFNDNAVSLCDPDDGCPPLRFDDSSGVYSYDSAYPDSRFVRSITVTPKPNHGTADEEALIEVKVTWNNGLLLAVPETFTIRERILNWQRK